MVFDVSVIQEHEVARAYVIQKKPYFLQSEMAKQFNKKSSICFILTLVKLLVAETKQKKF